MTLNEFQKETQRTATKLEFLEALTYYSMMLSQEANECGQDIRKHIFQGHELNKEHLLEECGDTLWALASLVNALGETLDDVALKNGIKLRNRYPDKFTPEASINRKD